MTFSHKFKFDNYIYIFFNELNKKNTENDEENYGIQLANMIGFPTEVIEVYLILILEFIKNL